MLVPQPPQVITGQAARLIVIAADERIDAGFGGRGIHEHHRDAHGFDDLQRFGTQRIGGDDGRRALFKQQAHGLTFGFLRIGAVLDHIRGDGEIAVLVQCVIDCLSKH